jgi:serine/threonine protein kinase
MRVCPRCRATYGDETKRCPREGAGLVDKDEYARVGQTIGNYRLVDILGQGGMGTVYRAEHVYIGKHFAAKVLPQKLAQYEDAVKRFLREARAASSIMHPNIVDVTDFGPVPGGGVFFVMEFLDGQSLEEVIAKQAPLALIRAINVVNQIALALAAAHDKQIVHRDLKPDNVMLIQRPGRRELVRTAGVAADGSPLFVVEKEKAYDFVKVLDFGIAKVMDEGTRLAADATGHVFGTPEYMAPEAARGAAIDHRADIYSLGCLFYDMITGRAPFLSHNPQEVLQQHIDSQPVPPSVVAPGAEITPATERLILKALAKDPRKRHQSMDELRIELQSCWGSVVYRRDAKKIPGATEAGYAPRQPRLSDELDEWLALHKDELSAVRKRMTALAEGGGEISWEAVVDPKKPG